MVEKLKYYEDELASKNEMEPITINSTEDTYYRPFSNIPLIFEARANSSCEPIESIFVCSSTPLCIWDNNVNSCFFKSNEFRFKSKNFREKKNQTNKFLFS